MANCLENESPLFPIHHLRLNAHFEEHWWKVMDSKVRSINLGVKVLTIEPLLDVQRAYLTLRSLMGLAWRWIKQVLLINNHSRLGELLRKALPVDQWPTLSEQSALYLSLDRLTHLTWSVVDIDGSVLGRDWVISLIELFLRNDVGLRLLSLDFEIG